MPEAGTRLDVALVARGLAASHVRAQALIAAGLVTVGGAPSKDAAQKVTPVTKVVVRHRDHPWAGRGGLKLAAGLDGFEVPVEGRLALDAGASTGGFTDVLLARGAQRVYAVDVGYGQLDPRLAGDERVVVLDRTNLRHLERLPGPPPGLVTLDLSFISLRLVLPRVAVLAPGADIIALVKPQFELGRAAARPGGVVRDVVAGEQAAVDLLSWAASELGTLGAGPLASPITGQKGNHEWLVHLRLPSAGGAA